MATTFYFYDLETSGFNSRQARIMQFAGQRTDMKLKPIGEPDNILVKLTKDVLPEPDAVLVHGISPRLTQSQGISEPELCKYLTSKVFTPNTVAVGFNNIRFDDEFIRHLFWRNFYDAYEWQWKDGRGKWDLLDASRMVRALRPAGIEWPFASDGKASNRLELLSSINKIQHDAVHDALSDVRAMIAFAQLIMSSQPKLFDYMLNLRDKTKVEVLVNKKEPIIYTSGRYPSEFEKTTVAVMAAADKERGGALMYDLRIDPTPFIKMAPSELAERWQARGDDAEYFPIKELKYNRCPTVAPLSVLDKETEKRLKLNMLSIERNHQKLDKAEKFERNLIIALEMIRPKKQSGMLVDEQEIDGLLYEDFTPNSDREINRAVRAAGPDKLKNFKPDFKDERLKILLPIYKARQFPEILSSEDKDWWLKYRQQKLVKSGWLERYEKRTKELLASPATAGHRNLLKELEDYGLAIEPKASVV